MPRINTLNIADADVTTRTILDSVKAKLGMLPNLLSTMAHAPVALNIYLAASDLLAKGRLDGRQREIIALATGQANACEYCLSAHTLMGKKSGLSDQEISRARQGSAPDSHDAAIARLAQRIVDSQGKLLDADLSAARQAGLDDGLILEVLSNVVVNIFTNYTNHIADTEIDFPKVELSL